MCSEQCGCHVPRPGSGRRYLEGLGATPTRGVWVRCSQCAPRACFTSASHIRTSVCCLPVSPWTVGHRDLGRTASVAPQLWQMRLLFTVDLEHPRRAFLPGRTVPSLCPSILKWKDILGLLSTKEITSEAPLVCFMEESYR